MPDFTAGAITALPTTPRSTGDVKFDQRIHDLVRDWGCDKSCDLVQEMVVTALKMGRENLTVADLKLFNRALKELRVRQPILDRGVLLLQGFELLRDPC